MPHTKNSYRAFWMMPKVKTYSTRFFLSCEKAMTGWYDFSDVKSSKMFSFDSLAEAHGLMYRCPSGKISVSHGLPDNGRSISRNVAEKCCDWRHDKLRNYEFKSTEPSSCFFKLTYFLARGRNTAVTNIRGNCNKQSANMLTVKWIGKVLNKEVCYGVPLCLYCDFNLLIYVTFIGFGMIFYMIFVSILNVLCYISYALFPFQVIFPFTFLISFNFL